MIIAIKELDILSGRDFSDAGACCHGYHSGQPVCINEGSGMHHRRQPGSPQGDGEDWGISGEHSLNNHKLLIFQRHACLIEQLISL